MQPLSHRGFRHFGRGISTLLLLAAAMALFPGCSRERDTKPTTTTEPKLLRIGFVPNEEDLEQRVRFDALAAHISKRLGIPVELVQTGTYSTAIEAMRAAKLDVCSLGPFAYLIAHEKTRAQAIIAPGTPAGEINTYRSIFVVPAASKIRSIEDVRTHAATMTLAWVDPASASGHLVPRAYLESVGIDPERAFKSTIFTLSHLASAMTVKSGQVDLAVITQNTLANLVKKGRLKSDDLRVIWTSEPIATSVVAVRGGLGEVFKEKVRAAYLSFRTEDPVNWSKFQRLFVDPATIWVAAEDKDYNELRALARSVKHLDLLDK
jgi:phosphonate transport system substrate-binding protein